MANTAADWVTDRLEEAIESKRTNPDLRLGQALYNVTVEKILHSNMYDRLREKIKEDGSIDPFYDNRNITKFLLTLLELKME